MTNHTQDEPETFPVIASTHWDGKRVFYVADTPHDCPAGVHGVDGFLPIRFGVNFAHLFVLSSEVWTCPRCTSTTGQPVEWDHGTDPDTGYADRGEGCTECQPGGWR